MDFKSGPLMKSGESNYVENLLKNTGGSKSLGKNGGKGMFSRAAAPMKAGFGSMKGSGAYRSKKNDHSEGRPAMQNQLLSNWLMHDQLKSTQVLNHNTKINSVTRNIQKDLALVQPHAENMGKFEELPGSLNSMSKSIGRPPLHNNNNL